MLGHVNIIHCLSGSIRVIMTHRLDSIKENINNNKMMDKKPLFYEHDYCGANFTWNIEDRAFNKKFTRNTVDKWTNRLSVHVHADVNLNKSIARELAIHRVQYSFLPEQQIRGKVFTKFGIPTIMGGILSRPLSIFSGSSSSEFSQKSRKNSSRMSRRGKIAKLEAISQLTSEEMREIAELKNPRMSDIRKKTIDSSQIITNESEILSTFISEFEFPEAAQISPKMPRKLTPFYPSLNTHSIYSQSTQVATQNSQLPDFQQTFGALMQNNNLEIINKDLSNQHYSTLSAKSLVSTSTNISEILKDTGLPESPQLSLTLAETQNNIDPDDLSTQSLSLPFPVRNERLIAAKARSPIRSQGLKKTEPESLWTDIEETCGTESSTIELTNDGVSQSSNTDPKATEATGNQLKYQKRKPELPLTDFEETCEMRLSIIDTTINDVDHWDNKVVNPCSISIGTSLATPEFLTLRSQAVDTVDHDHCYDDKSNESVSHKRKSDVLKSNSGRHAANNVRRNKFSKDEFKKMRTVEHGMVKKDNKRKTDYYVNKESTLVTKPRYYNYALLAQTRRLSLNDLNENEAKSPEFPIPAGKRVRLSSPDTGHESLKNRNSAISSRVLTPFYAEYKNIKCPGLTPFYTSFGDMDRCDSTTSSTKQRKMRRQRLTPNYSYHKSSGPVVIDISSDNEDENNAEESVNKLISFYPKEETYEPEVIDFSAGTEDATSIGKLEIDHFGTEASQLATKVKTSSQTVLSSVKEALESTLPLPTNIPVATNDDGISSLLNSQCSISIPVRTDELFSNLCCEYDYNCRNVPSGEITVYEPTFFKHLVVSSDKEIRKNINKALKFLESLEDLS